MMTNQNQQTRPMAIPSPSPAAPGQMAATMPRAYPMPAPQPMPAPHPQAPQYAHPPAMPQMHPQPGHAPMPPAQGYPQPPQMQPQMAPQHHIHQQHSAPQAPIGHAMPAPMAMPPVMRAEEEAAREGGEKSLPSVSIEAFCDRPDTAGAIDATKRDWRMKRVNLSVYMGGLSAAIEYYHKESTPNLIMIESGMRGPELFSQLEQLAAVCDAGTKVVVIGAANDIRLYRQLIDQGVSDYLVPPLSPLGVIHSLGDLFGDPDKPFIGRVAAFFGAKGGVGSSTLAHNIAWCMAENIGQQTALVDLDASWGTTGLDFAYDNSHGLEEALAEPERLDETLLDRIMLRHTANLSILPAAGTLGNSPVMTPEAYEAVVDVVRSVSPMTILDMPHYWAPWTTRILVGCDDVVITASPDLASLRNTKNLIDYLRDKRPNDPDPILILNRTGMTKTNEISVKDFGAAVGLDPAVALAFDPEIYTQASNDGKMLTDIKAASGHVTGFDMIASRLKTGRYPDLMAAGGKKKKGKGGSGESKSFFAKLKGK